MDRTRIGYLSAFAIGTGTAIFLSCWWLWRNKKSKPPTTWRKVGELGDIFLFPVKSFAFIKEKAVECTLLGPKSGWLRDRSLMMIDLNNKFVTARQYPRMIQIIPTFTGSVLTLHAPDMVDIDVDLSNIGRKIRAMFWGEPSPGCDCGDEVAKWLSTFLLQEETGFRLIYYPLDQPCRHAKFVSSGFPLMENEDVGAYPDASSYSMLNEASVMELNTRLDDPITPVQFRLNFIVKGAEAFEEDMWDWIRIGTVIFRNVRPCTRCIVTTIDPDNATKHQGFEPLKTLRKYRQIEDPIYRKSVRDSPVMGIHLGLKGPSGVVKIGDAVYVGVCDDESGRVIMPKIKQEKD